MAEDFENILFSHKALIICSNMARPYKYTNYSRTIYISSHKFGRKKNSVWKSVPK